MNSPPPPFASRKNTIFTGDNLHVLHGLNSKSVDLIYLDPPYNSKRMYGAPIGSKAAGASFKDTWTWDDVNQGYLEHLINDHPYLVQYIESIGALHSKGMMAYIAYMTQRLVEMHRVLKTTGSLYLHCDPTASHYLKPVLDRLFGKKNFRNEIVWDYGKISNSNAKKFLRGHDIILFYTKSTAFTFNVLYEDKISQRKQQLIKLGYNTKNQNGKKYLFIYDEAKVEEKVRQGLIDKSKFDIVSHVDPKKGNRIKDIFSIAILNSQAKEFTGYPTQKPLALLHQIIKASSRPGDVVLDPFCGCATACVAAQQLSRNWIGIDVSEKAAELLMERLADDAGLFKDFIHLQKPPQRTDIETIVITPTTKANIKTTLYASQERLCNGCSKEMDAHNLEIDHIIPSSKGGGNYYENYQLLCGHCNRVKGDRPMEYLRVKIAIRNEQMNKQITFGS